MPDWVTEHLYDGDRVIGSVEELQYGWLATREAKTKWCETKEKAMKWVEERDAT